MWRKISVYKNDFTVILTLVLKYFLEKNVIFIFHLFTYFKMFLKIKIQLNIMQLIFRRQSEELWANNYI